MSLKEEDKLCFKCILPDCEEHSIFCLRKKYTKDKEETKKNYNLLKMHSKLICVLGRKV